MIYPVDSVIQSLNNWGQVYNRILLLQFWMPLTACNRISGGTKTRFNLAVASNSALKSLFGLLVLALTRGCVAVHAEISHLLPFPCESINMHIEEALAKKSGG